MAVIDIKLTQTALDAGGNLGGTDGNGTLGTIFDSIAGISHAVDESLSYYASWSFLGSTLRLDFSDGSSEVFTGVALSNPGAQSGTATATGIEVRLAGVVTIAEAGLYSFKYDVNASNQLSLVSTASTTAAARIATVLPAYSPDYNQEFGNVAIQFNGSLSSDPSGNTSGNVSKIVLSADKVLSSTTVAGDFNISGNALTIAQGLSHSSVTGTMASYVTEFRDGSYERISGLSAPLSAASVIDSDMLADSALFGGDDSISVDLPAQIYGDAWIMAGAGKDTVKIGGGGGQLHVDTGAGNDVISALSGSHRIDGGSGFDVLKYSGARAGYTVAKTAVGFNVSASGGGVDMTGNIERLQFSDTALAFDISGNAGMAYRVYQAAFNRTPDMAGLSYWIGVLDANNSMRDVAGSFIGSPEFQGMYGANPSVDVFVTSLYANVLHRAPDQGGFDFWSASVKNGMAYADVLVSFSESAENQLQVIGAIQNGIAYTPVA
ncbi:DUF4214 domain-containing protein [Pseudoduganella sp. LjRoot289]|uniref:DUF4214 domain-containing protein n=1 Tax=Pseudoduganella sp. LjRoot289 TaxID=3342314 RepID=UPI003ECC7AD7